MRAIVRYAVAMSCKIVIDSSICLCCSVIYVMFFSDLRYLCADLIVIWYVLVLISVLNCLFAYGMVHSVIMTSVFIFYFAGISEVVVPLPQKGTRLMCETFK